MTTEKIKTHDELIGPDAPEAPFKVGDKVRSTQVGEVVDVAGGNVAVMWEESDSFSITRGSHRGLRFSVNIGTEKNLTSEATEVEALKDKILCLEDNLAHVELFYQELAATVLHGDWKAEVDLSPGSSEGTRAMDVALSAWRATSEATHVSQIIADAQGHIDDGGYHPEHRRALRWVVDRLQGVTGAASYGGQSTVLLVDDGLYRDAPHDPPVVFQVPQRIAEVAEDLVQMPSTMQRWLEVASTLRSRIACLDRVVAAARACVAWQEQHDTYHCMHGELNDACRGCAGMPPHFPVGIDEFTALASSIVAVTDPVTLTDAERQYGQRTNSTSTTSDEATAIAGRLRTYLDTSDADLRGRGAGGRGDAPAVADVGGAAGPSAGPHPAGNDDASGDAGGARVGGSDRVAATFSALVDRVDAAYGGAEMPSVLAAGSTSVPPRETCDCGACAICASMRTGPELLAELTRDRTSEALRRCYCAAPDFACTKCGAPQPTEARTDYAPAEETIAPPEYANVPDVTWGTQDSGLCQCSECAAKDRSHRVDVWPFMVSHPAARAKGEPTATLEYGGVRVFLPLTFLHVLRGVVIDPQSSYGASLNVLASALHEIERRMWKEAKTRREAEQKRSAATTPKVEDRCAAGHVIHPGAKSCDHDCGGT